MTVELVMVVVMSRGEWCGGMAVMVVVLVMSRARSGWEGCSGGDESTDGDVGLVVVVVTVTLVIVMVMMTGSNYDADGCGDRGYRDEDIDSGNENKDNDKYDNDKKRKRSHFSIFVCPLFYSVYLPLGKYCLNYSWD